MLGNERPRFLKPANDTLYPMKNKDGSIEVLINPNSDAALTSDADSKSTFTYNRHHHLPLDAQRQKLPIFQYRNHILYLLEKYQTLVLVGETGSGKSTQVPQYTFEIGHKVCVTQPRVTAAMSLAMRVAEERGDLLGQSVGYSAGMTSQRCADSGIVYMTEGVLLREMFASPLLLQYSCIILDEVHERSQMTDVLMGLLKKIARKRKKLKIIVSSATMDAEFLKDFFDLGSSKERKSTSVIMTIQGRTHPVDTYYLAEPTPNYVKATVDTVIKIHENQPFGDVLAFLTSQEEIHEALNLLTEYAEDNNKKNTYRTKFPSGMIASNLSVLPMYGSLPHYKQIRVFQMSERNVRKVILATNIAETSVTIPGIVYVIDCGFHKLPYFDVKLSLESLVITPIAKNNAIQRSGRAGRTQRGKCFRLYTEEIYNSFPSSVPPEMLRSDLSSILLQLKALGIHNLLRFTFPTPPPAKSLLSGLELLFALGALDKLGNLTDDCGHKMAELPLKPMCAKMLCNSGKYGCIDEILSIVSMLQVDNLFVRSGGKDNIAAKIARRNHFEVAEGDIIMYLNIMEAYMKVKLAHSDEKRSKKASKNWCAKLYINYRVIEKACEIRSSLEKIIKNKFQMENNIYDGPDLGTGKCIRTMKCVTSGLFPFAAHSTSTGYRTLSGAAVALASDSCLYRTTPPAWVVFAGIQCSADRTSMRHLLAVHKEWLLEEAPHYYTHT